MKELVTIEFPNDTPAYSMTEVFELVDDAAKNLRRIQRLTIRESGLTPPQYQVMQTLWTHDGVPLKSLADECNCTRATITGLIDVLERKGLVYRQPNPKDRRSILASLTDEGRVFQNQAPALESIYNQCCNGLDPHEFQQFGQLLHKLNQSLFIEEQ
jgi:DNA-binding MarR family transcriptional regulator